MMQPPISLFYFPGNPRVRISPQYARDMYDYATERMPRLEGIDNFFYMYADLLGPQFHGQLQGFSVRRGAHVYVVDKADLLKTPFEPVDGSLEDLALMFAMVLKNDYTGEGPITLFKVGARLTMLEEEMNKYFIRFRATELKGIGPLSKSLDDPFLKEYPVRSD